MNSCFSIKIVLALLISAGVNVAVCRGQAAGDVQGTSQYIILKNGNVLHGEVLEEGQYYQVKIPGGEFRVRHDRVEMCCDELEEAYEKRRSERTATSADSHIDLASWCMRHDLLRQAAVELDEARQIEPDHRRIAQLERQLVQLVKLAAYEERRPPTPKQLEVVQEQEVNLNELEKAPKWAKALFVRQIQPLLVQSCSTTGCHQPGSAEQFQLNRFALDGAGHPDLTQENLARTLEYIDWKDPQESQLLRLAREAHGPSSHKKQKRLSQHKLLILDMWVNQLAQANALNQPQEVFANEQPPAVEPAQSLPVEKSAAEEISLTNYQQQDPFDPEFFNQRYAERPEISSSEAVSVEPPASPLDVPPPLAVPGE